MKHSFKFFFLFNIISLQEVNSMVLLPIAASIAILGSVGKIFEFGRQKFNEDNLKIKAKQDELNKSFIEIIKKIDDKKILIENNNKFILKNQDNINDKKFYLSEYELLINNIKDNPTKQKELEIKISILKQEIKSLQIENEEMEKINENSYHNLINTIVKDLFEDISTSFSTKKYDYLNLNINDIKLEIQSNIQNTNKLMLDLLEQFMNLHIDVLINKLHYNMFMYKTFSSVNGLSFTKEKFMLIWNKIQNKENVTDREYLYILKHVKNYLKHNRDFISFNQVFELFNNDEKLKINKLEYSIYYNNNDFQKVLNKMNNQLFNLQEIRLIYCLSEYIKNNNIVIENTKSPITHFILDNYKNIVPINELNINTENINSFIKIVTHNNNFVNFILKEDFTNKELQEVLFNILKNININNDNNIKFEEALSILSSFGTILYNASTISKVITG